MSRGTGYLASIAGGVASAHAVVLRPPHRLYGAGPSPINAAGAAAGRDAPPRAPTPTAPHPPRAGQPLSAHAAAGPEPPETVSPSAPAAEPLTPVRPAAPLADPGRASSPARRPAPDDVPGQAAATAADAIAPVPAARPYRSQPIDRPEIGGTGAGRLDAGRAGSKGLRATTDLTAPELADRSAPIGPPADPIQPQGRFPGPQRAAAASRAETGVGQAPRSAPETSDRLSTERQTDELLAVPPAQPGDPRLAAPAIALEPATGQDSVPGSAAAASRPTQRQRAPRVHIGKIDVTVLPPPALPAAAAAQAPAVRTAAGASGRAREPLSRGAGPWFGLSQR